MKNTWLIRLFLLLSIFIIFEINTIFALTVTNDITIQLETRICLSGNVADKTSFITALCSQRTGGSFVTSSGTISDPQRYWRNSQYCISTQSATLTCKVTDTCTAEATPGQCCKIPGAKLFSQPEPLAGQSCCLTNQTTWAEPVLTITHLLICKNIFVIMDKYI